MSKSYTRCDSCSEVYEKNLEECPKCGKPNIINEELSEDIIVFNIID